MNRVIEILIIRPNSAEQRRTGSNSLCLFAKNSKKFWNRFESKSKICVISRKKWNAYFEEPKFKFENTNLNELCWSGIWSGGYGYSICLEQVLRKILVLWVSVISELIFLLDNFFAGLGLIWGLRIKSMLIKRHRCPFNLNHKIFREKFII